jgi:hypothetical protein
MNERPCESRGERALGHGQLIRNSVSSKLKPLGGSDLVHVHGSWDETFAR